MLEREFGIRDSVAHIIPDEELDPRTKETEDILNLLRENSVVILTADTSGSGKSTFARILRHKILTQDPKDPDFPDSLYMKPGDIVVAYIESKRQDFFTTRDQFSYRDLRRFQGLIIFDEVYPEYIPLILTIDKARLLLIAQPNFLKGPPFDDEEHSDFVNWVNQSLTPVYRIERFQKPEVEPNTP